MDIQIQQITGKFNEKLKTISLEKKQMHQRLTRYRKELYAYERAKERNEENFEKLNPNERYIEMARSFFGKSNLTIEECIKILEKDTEEVRDLIESYKKAIKQYYLENQITLYTVRRTKHEIIKKSQNIGKTYTLGLIALCRMMTAE